MSKLAKALTAAAGNAGGDNLYVEDVFSTYLYTGNNTGTNTQNIVNGIDLAGEGGAVWIKTRNVAWNHGIWDTETDGGNLYTNTTDAQQSNDDLASFNSDGFGVSSAVGTGWYNSNDQPQVSWTFRKAEKFFDVVTYTGDGTDNRDIPHGLGSTPGSIFIKRLSGASAWRVWHRDLTSGDLFELNATDGEFADTSIGEDHTSTTFDVNNSFNSNGDTEDYVAYLFAHDAGGFGADGSESIIKCGTIAIAGTNNGNIEIDCGFEPQFILLKRTDSAENWYVVDNMRGAVKTDTALLFPNLSIAELQETNSGFFTSTGYNMNGYGINRDYIYIAIRRPMKTPESGAEVFAIGTNQEVPSATSGFYSGFPVDMAIKRIITASQPNYLFDRLRGGQSLVTNTTAAESGFSAAEFDHQNGWYYDSDSANTNDYSWMFKRATGFFDVVAYSGDGTANKQITHSLGVAPDIVIVKRQNGIAGWVTWNRGLADGGGYGGYMNLETSSPAATGGQIFGTAATQTSEHFTLGSAANITQTNSTGGTFVAYLFATLAGVSKVGSYTGTGSNVDVDCGFSAGARFILIKRTDSASNWYLWDSARGIVAGNDPYIQLNNTNAQNSGQDAIDPLASGFTVTAAADVNQSGGNYIFLAIA